MRVLLLSNVYPTVSKPAAGVFVSQRIKALEARGHQVWPVGIRGVRTGAWGAVARLRGRRLEEPVPAPPFGDYLLPVGPLRRLRPWTGTAGLSATQSLTDLVEQERIDLVHAHGMYLFAAGSIARDVAHGARVPYVVTLHGQDVNVYLRRRRPHHPGVLEGADGVICVSQDLARTVRRSTGVDRPVHVVPNGYDPEIFRIGAEDPPRGADVLFVGNLERVKGADRLPALISRVREHRPDAGLDVVGTGSLDRRLRQRLPDARFHGQVGPAQVAAHMRRAGVLVVPSRSEGWGAVITEAHACGLPAVAFDVGGIPEAVQLTQHLVPAREGVAGLARRVVEVLGDGRSRQELSRLVHGSTWDEVAREEEQVYRAALNGPVLHPRVRGPQ